jgi:hypothetical protein
LLGRGGGGDFGPPGRERARLAAQLAQQRGGTMGDGIVARGPHASEGGGVNGADGNGGRGTVDRSLAGSGIPRWFSAVGPVLWRGSGSEARVGAGDHEGGVNLTGGGLGRPVRGAMAGVHGGEVAGEAVGCNRGRGGVPRDRERVAELKH